MLDKPRKKILFVDDNIFSVHRIMNTFDKKKFEVKFTESIDDAIKTIEENENNNIKFSLVVVDLFIPGSSSIDTNQKYYNVGLNQGQSLGIYLSEKNIPFLYLTNHKEQYSKPEMKSDNKLCIISKSEKTDSIIEIIKEKICLIH